MKAIEELLKDVEKDELAAYETYLHRHLKLFLTGINKARVQDLTDVKIKQNKCISKCYHGPLHSVEAQGSAHEMVENIRDCKAQCMEHQQKVKKYLDDINYYSLLKLRGCTKKCGGSLRSIEYNECWWTCYNRLDRRYKKYWQEQRQKVEANFMNDSS